MNRIFISDLHLETTKDPKYSAFLETLYTAVREQRELYILGDLVEVWIGDDDDSEFAQTLMKDLKTCAQQVDVYVMHGNRDFLYRQAWEQQTNTTLLPDPYVLETGNQNNTILLSHGDAYCTSDLAYMQARALFRSQEWQDGILASSLDDRRELARTLREQSKQHNQLKAANITDVVNDPIVEDLEKFGCTRMIHGHTHRPGIHVLSGDRTRIVLGDWDRCGWTLMETDGWFDLQRFAISD